MTRAPILSFVLAIAAPFGAAAQIDPVFDGVWEGTIEVAAVEGVRVPSRILPTDESPMPLQLEVRGRTATVKFDREFMLPEGGFQVEKFDAAALILAHAATVSWIETWQLSLTKTDADTVLIYVWRVVNNTGRRPEADYSKFAWGGVGELRRLQSPATDESAIHPEFDDVFETE